MRRRATTGEAARPAIGSTPRRRTERRSDRKSTRLNSSHLGISYAVFCLKKKKQTNRNYKNTNSSTRKRRCGPILRDVTTGTRRRRLAQRSRLQQGLIQNSKHAAISQTN